MSHLPERKEKNCLNCGTTVVGKYCHNCGQENIEPKESVWHLISHFFNDVTHFDGKFFTSLKDLLLRPGFLSKEYMLGRRMSFLNPIRMYLFTSFVFFLIFFSLYKVDENIVVVGINKDNIDKIDSTDLKELSNLNNGKPLTKEALGRQFDSSSITLTPTKYKSKKEYDSLLSAGVIKDNWFKKMLVYKSIQINEKYRYNKRLAMAKIVDKIQHSIPQMLFVLLPLFALLLKLLYIRRKAFYYTDHAIFAIHFYIFVFIAMLLIFGISKIISLTGLSWLQYINIALVLIIFYYLYKAMRNFYRQSRIKTFFKYLLLLGSFSFVGIFLFTLFLFISLFEI